jgi:hypothetical protein
MPGLRRITGFECPIVNVVNNLQFINSIIAILFGTGFLPLVPACYKNYKIVQPELFLISCQGLKVMIRSNEIRKLLNWKILLKCDTSTN